MESVEKPGASCLLPFYDDEGAVPAHLSPYYRWDEEIGRFMLQVEPQAGWSLEDVVALKQALRRCRQDKEALRRSVRDQYGKGAAPAADRGGRPGKQRRKGA